MKYLSNYIEGGQTKAFEEAGAFFAFGNKQYEEKAIKGIKYASMGAGLICPADKAKSLSKALNDVWKAGIEADLSDNGVKAIIHRELANHECQITMEWDTVVDVLKPYGITNAQIVAEWDGFFQNCIDNDYF